MKKIVLLSDGTGNSSADPQKTNVWRVYQALDLSPDSGQIAFYDNGVGTSRFKPTALLGLAFGWGLARNVREIYRFLCRTYEEGDEIYGFGFSRGAFTIRVVVALIASEGIVDRRGKSDQELNRWIRSAYRNYRRTRFDRSLLLWLFHFAVRPLCEGVSRLWATILKRDRYDREKNIRPEKDEDEESPLIKFVGVWDTVDAYGAPIDELTRAWDKVVWPLTAKDRNLSRRVGRGCQALAVDEQRESFEPMLWNEGRAKDLDERVTQVWFPGVHSNVGGGYPDDALAFVSLNWMLDQSEQDEGLRYLVQVRERYAGSADTLGPISDSRSGAGAFYRYEPRNIERLCNEKKPGLLSWIQAKLGWPGAESNEVVITKPKFHHSVFDRIAGAGDYAPFNIPADYAVVDKDGVAVDIEDPRERQGALPESSVAARQRRRFQSAVWTLVWCRKLVYYATLAAVLVFVLYPYTPFIDSRVADFLTTLVGTVSLIIRAIPMLVGKIPGLGLAASWAEEYGSHPFIFILGIAMIGGLLYTSAGIRARLRSQMLQYWAHVRSRQAPDAAEPGGWSRAIGRFVEGPAYVKRVARPIRVAVEALAIGVFILAVVVAGNRLFFMVADGFGAVCSETGPTRSFGEEFEFNPEASCFDTGLTLERGGLYRIVFRVSDDWSDSSISADARGWRDASWPWYLFTPVRRHLFAGWYQPIARVGDTRYDRYPIRETEANLSSDAHRVTTLTMHFRARSTGSLFLYLNDAVLLTPQIVKRFYANNDGDARVTVDDLSDPDASRAANSTPR